ncbi:MAG: HD domain-containing protein [SAR324 cluster bacterium]|nr:HD domain-containing protein [SAR324 cluster bacterium]
MEPIAKSDDSAARLAKIRLAILKRFPKSKSPRYSLLKQALQDAEFYHSDQYRKSGEPAIIHPYRVALLVSEAGMGIEAVIIALLHDIIEDTEFTKAEVADKYGEWLAEAVDGLTKVAAPQNRPRGDPTSIETYRKLLTSSVKDLRTLQVKIFDRLDNMRDLGFLERKRQRRIAMETMLVYVPMALRLGLQDISDELSTLCFRYLYPNRFNRVLAELQQRIADEQKKVRGLKKALEATFKEPDTAPCNVQPKYRKVADYVFEASPQVRPLAGFTVTVPSAQDCYMALGRLHMNYRVVPNSIRDYISNPKPNRHQALESKVFIGGEPITIEVFSTDMEKVHRSGILADWSASQEEMSRYYQSYLELLDQFAGNEDLRMEDVLRYGQMETLQIFTPKGEMLSFPQRATVLDFAFAIHTDLGIHCDGAWVEGRRAARQEELRDGTMVEVLTSPGTAPEANWLGYVRTARAKMAIRRHLRGQRLSRAQEVGHKLFDSNIKRMGLNPDKFMERKAFLKALDTHGLNPERFYQEIGTRQLNLRSFMLDNKLVSENELERLGPSVPGGLMRYLKRRSRHSDPDLRISGLGDEFIHLAPCCSPLRGDAIVGLQQESGILIHRTECSALEQVGLDALLSVDWDMDRQKVPYRFHLKIQDRPGMVYKIGKIMRDLKVNIQDMNIESKDALSQANVNILVDPIAVQTYQKIVSRLRAIKEVVKIT